MDDPRDIRYSIESFDRVPFAAQSAISKTRVDGAVSGTQSMIERESDLLLNTITLQVTRDYLGKPLSPQDVSATRAVYIKVPRTWWQWRRWTNNKPVKRWRHVKVTVDSRFTGLPVVLFPHQEMGVIPKKLGRPTFMWKPDNGLDISGTLA